MADGTNEGGGIVRNIMDLFGRLGGRPEATDTTTRSFGVGPAPRVIANNQAGTLRVVTGSAGTITAEVVRKARGGTEEDARRALEGITVALTQEGDTVHLEVRIDQSIFRALQLWADVVLTVPPTTSLDLKLRAGSMEVSGTTGALSATVNAGEFHGHGLTIAGSSRILVNAGEMRLDGALASGAALEVRVDVGTARLTLPASTAAHLEAVTDVGAISISGWPITVRQELVRASASGDLGPNPTGRLSIHVTTGDLKLAARA
jgi:hypothetical protein